MLPIQLYEQRKVGRTCRAQALAAKQQPAAGHAEPESSRHESRQIFVTRKHQSTRVTACKGNAQSLETTHDMKIVNRFAAELFEQVEDDVRSKNGQQPFKLSGVVVHSGHLDLMA